MTVKIMAKLWSRLPKHFHYQGEPNDWVRMTRPGQRLHSFIEGPCFDETGQLWLVDVPYGRIFRIGEDGIWQLAHEYDGQPHAIKSVGNGSWLIADYLKGLVHFREGEPIHVLYEGLFGEQRFLGLSDLIVSDGGKVWFTDSGRSSLFNPTGRVFRCQWRANQGVSGLRLVLDNAPYPNGIALSPCGTYVYCAVTRGNAIWRLSTQDPNPEQPMVGVWVHLSGGLGPDGLAVDRWGNVAVAQAQAGRVYVFNPLGDLRATIVLPEGMWTTAVTFAADEANHLYITEAQTGSIYAASTRAYLE